MGLSGKAARAPSTSSKLGKSVSELAISGSFSYFSAWIAESIHTRPTISMADGGGFEPPVPFGTHAFQACTINRSVTHPEKSSASSES